MSDDFGTVNMRRNDRSREIEVMRQQYRRHREALAGLASDAPTEYLATEYQRLIIELDASLKKLNELEAPGSTASVASAAAGPSGVDTQPMRTTDPGKRRLASTPTEYQTPVEEIPRTNRGLLGAILAAGLVVLAILGWLMLRSTANERPSTPIVSEQPVKPATVTEETTTIPAAQPVPIQPAGGLKAEPATRDFGVIRKGTRAVRQFDITNSTDQPITINVARSNCRCLYYSHAPVIPPKGKETVTVTIDGGRAKPGAIQESIKVSSKADASIATTMNLTATVR